MGEWREGGREGGREGVACLQGLKLAFGGGGCCGWYVCDNGWVGGKDGGRDGRMGV